MLVSDILRIKGSDVISVGPDHTIVETARKLKGRGIGAVVVLDDSGRLAGLISERDIVHAIAMHAERALDMQVKDVMTTKVITCQRDDTVDEAMKVMVEHAFRHLPVAEDGELKGLVSISDVVKLRITDLERKIQESTVFEHHH